MKISKIIPNPKSDPKARDAARISDGGNTLGVSLVGGPVAKPQAVGEFSKILKDFKKIAKMHYLSLIFKKFKNLALIFCAFGRKIQIIGKF